MSKTTNKQQDHTNKLKQKLGSPIYVSNLQYDSKTKKYTPRLRYTPDKFEIYDDRTVGINEIIWDLDFSSYKKNAKYAKKIIETLQNRRIPPLICATGGKGIHIHTIFNPIQFTNEENKTLFKTALSYQLDWKHIRLWIFNKILDESGINEGLRGKGKPFDTAPITFNYHQGTQHLIRAIGGRKIEVDEIEGSETTRYKTWIPTAEFNDKKVSITNFEQVRFPEDIPTFNIDEPELVHFLNNFVQNQQKQSIIPEQVRYTGKYTELDGVLKIREGLPAGQRNAGATVLAIASKIDGYTLEESKQLMSSYVKKCSQSGHKFTDEEAFHWLRWIYIHESPFWNCSLLKDLNVHEDQTCEYCQEKYKEANKLLTQTSILQQIKEVLDQEIIGEDHNKMLIFLLLLSKDFPSETGRRGWNMFGDPQSQNIILSCDSSSGKSWIIKKILDIFGEENTDYFIISRITKNALNYYTDINMDGKIVFIEELQGLDENTSQLRVWMSEGKLSLQTVEKTINEEGLEVNALIKKNTVGQPVFVTNQAEGVVETQLNNRSWVLSLDTTSGQTKDILSFQDKVNKGQITINKTKKRMIVDAIKQLKPYHFKIDFADFEAMGIPVADVRARRDYQKFLTLIKCSAYLYQRQRKIEVDENHNEYVVCDIKDYNIARQYSESVLGATFSGLTNAQIDLIQTIRNSPWNAEFMISDVMRVCGKTQPHWYGMLKQLEDLGYVISEKSAGKSTRYELVMDKAVNVINLPNGEELLQKLRELLEPASPISAISYSNIYVPEYTQIGSDSSEMCQTDSKCVKEELIAVIGDNHPQKDEIIQYSPLNDELRKPYQETSPIKKDGLRKREKTKAEYTNMATTFQSKESLPPPSFIGDNPTPNAQISRYDIIEFFKKSKKHIITGNDLLQRFGQANHEAIFDMVCKLCSEGTLFKTKPDQYMLL